MENRFNSWSFYLILICIGLAAYSLYSNIYHTWLIAPPNYILFIISLLALTLGILGLEDKRNRLTKTRSWLTITLSTLTSIGLFVVLTFTAIFSGVNEHVKTVNSPDGHYTIDFYRYNAGAAGSFGVRGELDGPLWFKKRIYYEDSAHLVEVEWKDDSTVEVNNHTLNLNKGGSYGY
ncbi:DUF5412 family protein [Aquisalibacillus elongatus]|uniref:Uncharacterized protein n=1 Tax=Aquisalibacillus elongatus TaxID=485577 RepID=A0A3N5CE96_9BACI|nr:DUF5412 family protein [Aquisalibacillus elongatus]RPF55501.1 hypothetical protein EDC24_0379 [Aquisalibacillus elongatus]